jgi:uroporphyrin-III C-methyltransferase
VSDKAEENPVAAKGGIVYLVGAGPGDPELLTQKAVRLLKSADVVVYDRLVSPEILAEVPKGVTCISVGKQPGNHPVPQDDINELLVRLARNNRRVVRLKGGDPFIFGRGSEEAARLAECGIPYEVVPGITAAQGCAAALKVPLTHRGLATGVRYLTGHCRQNGELDFDWQGLADPDTTLVIYMGKANIGRITGELLQRGLEPATPVLVVCNGTTDRQQHLSTTLQQVPGEAEVANLDGPVLFIVGKVAGLAGSLEVQDDAFGNDAATALG